MRSTLMVVLLGVSSGAVGALVVSHFNRAPETPPAAPRAPRVTAEAAGIVPPGWDPRLVARVPSPPSPPSVSASPTPAPAERDRLADKERQRAELYRDELQHRENELVNHGAEALDSAWADSQDATVRAALTGSGNGAFNVKSVDCRSKTCVAELTFPSPAQAIARHSAIETAAPAGCHGMFSALTPPTSDGPYDATVIYYCR